MNIIRSCYWIDPLVGYSATLTALSKAGREWTGFIWLRIGTGGGEFVDWLGNCQLLKKDYIG
jgi:hypothetical protein